VPEGTDPLPATLAAHNRALAAIVAAASAVRGVVEAMPSI